MHFKTSIQLLISIALFVQVNWVQSALVWGHCDVLDSEVSPVSTLSLSDLEGTWYVVAKLFGTLETTECESVLFAASADNETLDATRQSMQEEYVQTDVGYLIAGADTSIMSNILVDVYETATIPDENFRIILEDVSGNGYFVTYKCDTVVSSIIYQEYIEVYAASSSISNSVLSTIISDLENLGISEAVTLATVDQTNCAFLPSL